MIKDWNLAGTGLLFLALGMPAFLEAISHHRRGEDDPSWGSSFFVVLGAGMLLGSILA